MLDILVVSVGAVIAQSHQVAAYILVPSGILTSNTHAVIIISAQAIHDSNVTFCTLSSVNHHDTVSSAEVIVVPFTDVLAPLSV